jgi:hypothetical protein
MVAVSRFPLSARGGTRICLSDSHMWIVGRAGCTHEPYTGSREECHNPTPRSMRPSCCNGASAIRAKHDTSSPVPLASGTRRECRCGGTVLRAMGVGTTFSQSWAARRKRLVGRIPYSRPGKVFFLLFFLFSFSFFSFFFDFKFQI